MAEESQRKQVLFDRSTGVILGTYALYDGDAETYLTPPPDEALKMFGSLPGGRTPDQVEVIEAAIPGGSRRGGYRVDLARRQIVPKFELQLQPEQTAIRGDGKASVLIKIRVLGGRDRVATGFQGEVRVTTTHGRLSTEGGRVQLKKGTGSITLTSTVETIERVQVSGRDPSGKCESAFTIIEFL